MAKLWKNKVISREVKLEIYERVVIPTVVYGSETWSLSAQERSRIEVFEMMCLRNICGLRRVGRVRNIIIRERCGCELSVLERIEKNMLKIGSGMWKEWEKKAWLRECIRKMWRGDRGRRRSQSR